MTERETEAAVRFGILGCATIARKVSRAIRLAPNARLVGVASRTLEKARQFASENGFPEDAHIYGSYEELLQDPAVDAVYIPLPTSLHRRWVEGAARSGKHVLVEKPVAMNAGELQEMLAICEEEGVQFMDGTMWMHHPRTAKMRELLSDASLFGDLKWVHSAFTFAGDDNFLENDIRVKPDLDALGSLGDAGWYCIRSILWAAEYELPKTVTATCGSVSKNAAGVLLSCGASLKWDDGRVATFYCSFDANMTMNLTVTGTRGTLTLRDFIVPFEENSATFSLSSKTGLTELALGWHPIPVEHHLSTDLPQEACMRGGESERMAGSATRRETETAVRFGIMGCATIARKVSRAIRLAPNARLVAVASRTVEKARQFASENSFPQDAHVYGSYEELLQDPAVDAVYIPLPTSLHRRWVAEAARLGKHLLVEKPVALNAGELQEMLEICEEKGVQFMDGTMWMHHPRTAKMRELLSNGTLFGNLKWVNSAFTFAGNDCFMENNIRVKADLDALGALGDTGWYCIRSILWAVDYQLPKTVTATPGSVSRNAAGVLLSCGSSLQWDDGRVATFHCSFDSNRTMNLTVAGTRGTLILNDFVVPFDEISARFSLSSNTGLTEMATGWHPLPVEHRVPSDLPQEVCMVSEFARLVRSIKDSGSKPDQGWPDITKKTHLVIDAVIASIDKGFETVTL